MLTIPCFAAPCPPPTLPFPLEEPSASCVIWAFSVGTKIIFQK